MRGMVVALAALLALTACQDMMESTQRVGYNVRKEAVKTSNRISEYFRIEEQKPPPPKRQVMAPRYCYKVLTDTVCYRNPQPGAERRLVGYYEPPAEDGSLFAAYDSMVIPPSQQVYVRPIDAVVPGQSGGGAAAQATTPQPLLGQ